MDFSSLNDSCLVVFGQEFLFTRVTSAPEGAPVDPVPITGIPDPGARLEQSAPGEDSTYMELWIQEGTVDPAPAKGDEISTATTVYKIVDKPEDAAGGITLLLRKDRAVE